jgi:hypothetical protein
MRGRDLSVLIPTQDAGLTFPPLLESLRAQRGIGGLEIVVADSGTRNLVLELEDDSRLRAVSMTREQRNALKREILRQHPELVEELRGVIGLE